MRRNNLCIVFFVITALFMSNVCLAGINPTESCDVVKKTDDSQISENTLQKKELLPLDDIISSVFQLPGDIIDGISNIPLNDIASSTLEVPGNAVKFVAEIPYDEIAWSTLKVSAEVIEFIVDDGFVLGFLVGHYYHH